MNELKMMMLLVRTRNSKSIFQFWKIGTCICMYLACIEYDHPLTSELVVELEKCHTPSRRQCFFFFLFPPINKCNSKCDSRFSMNEIVICDLTQWRWATIYFSVNYFRICSHHTLHTTIRFNGIQFELFNK